MGKILVRKMATLSIRMERSEKQETAAIARRVLHAVDDYDHGRLDEADRLFDLLGEEPRINLRKLRKSPEGVDRLILAWQELKAEPDPRASAALDRLAPRGGRRTSPGCGSNRPPARGSTS